jgi:hypothetical protein
VRSRREPVSTALRDARLRSERLRILILIGIAVVVLILRSTITAVFPSPENFHLWVIGTSLVACFIAYEALVVRGVNNALANGRDLPNSAFAGGTVQKDDLTAVIIKKT